MKKSLALFTCIASLASVAVAGLYRAETTTIKIADTAITVPIPQGYCLLDGAQIEMSNRIAAMDAENLTHFTSKACNEDLSAGDPFDYFILKTPKSSLPAKMERPEFLASMKAFFAGPGDKVVRDAADEGMSKVSGDATSLIGQKVLVDGQITPLGIDSVCAYLGGLFSATLEDQRTIKAAAGVCMTTVSGRWVTVNWYTPDATRAGLDGALKKARALALAMK